MFERIQSKILNWESAETQIFEWQSKGEKVVFTNGCFDLLHFGHIQYLAEARSLGDRLIIGLNNAASVTRLKGPNRPINDEKTRLFQLAAMEFVDAIVIFEEDTPYNLIYFLQPDILVKGGDWQPDQIIGADIVLKKGGEVKSLDFVKGYSTSIIEQKIKDGGK